MGYRSVITQQHPVAKAVRLALASGVLSLALPALPAAAQAAATDAATQQAAPGGNVLLAQNVPQTAGGTETNPLSPAPLLQEVVVTGFRESLAKATSAKRDSIGFTDSIYAEDIGKFADNNIAESFNRIPGITITRDNTGQGVDIAIRGL
ncbi:MAG: TonB-dependent receptor plug domain-containing protein, partial [Gammaproteobacteria bacterium]|nr:TonB-dependent receptor plug domain-containing protein [Gammaproteobacteria bacterium]